MMATSTRVDLLECLLAFLGRYAVLEYSSDTALEKFIADDGVPLSSAHDAIYLSLIFRKLLPQEARYNCVQSGMTTKTPS